MQTQRPRRPPALSAVEVTGFDALDIFEQYYRRAEQNPARFYELAPHQCLMALGMPGADHEWLANLDQQSAKQLSSASRHLERRTLRFECGCNPRKMLSALRGSFAHDPQDLFRGQPRVESHCPRCGRRWWTTREQFDAAGDL